MFVATHLSWRKSYGRRIGYFWPRYVSWGFDWVLEVVTQLSCLLDWQTRWALFCLVSICAYANTLVLSSCRHYLFVLWCSSHVGRRGRCAARWNPTVAWWIHQIVYIWRAKKTCGAWLASKSTTRDSPVLQSCTFTFLSVFLSIVPQSVLIIHAY